MTKTVSLFAFTTMILSCSPLWATTDIQPSTSEDFTLDALPCPSQVETVSMLKEARVNVESFNGPKEWQCDRSQISKLARLLFFLKSLKPQITPEFQNHEIIKKIRSPWQFFIASYNEIRFFESKRAVAAYELTSKNLLLTDFLFELDPTMALATLIHEAAHGHHPDRFHALCHRGNLKHTLGACDEALEKKEKLAGSYSYEFWFLWMLGRFDSNLSAIAKKRAQDHALQLVANRFNYVHEVGQFNDLIMVLTENGTPKLLDPLSQNLIDIGIPEKIVGGPTKSLIKDERHMGVAFLSETNRLTSWEAISGFKNKIDSLPIEALQGNIKNFLRGYNFQDRITRSLLLTNDGRVLIESTANGDRVYIPDRELEKLGPIKSVEMLSDKRYIVHLENGSLRVFENGQLLPIPHNLESSTIQSLSSSIMGFHFHVIDSIGAFWNGKFKMSRINPYEVRTSAIEFKPDSLQAPSGDKALKYDEGIGHRALLTANSRIVIDRHSVLTTSQGVIDFPSKVLPVKESLKDLVFLRTATIDDHYKFANDRTLFEQKCGFQPTLVDPWLGRPMGVRTNGDLIAFTLGTCSLIAKEVQSIKLNMRSISLNPVGLRETEMIVTFRDGRVVTQSGY